MPGTPGLSSGFDRSSILESVGDHRRFGLVDIRRYKILPK